MAICGTHYTTNYVITKIINNIHLSILANNNNIEKDEESLKEFACDLLIKEFRINDDRVNKAIMEKNMYRIGADYHITIKYIQY